MNSNGNGKPRDALQAAFDKQVEEHSPKFTGCWLPSEIMELLWSGKISAKETVLLATINCLIDQKHHKGCFASNAYLAKMIGIKEPTSVAHMISKLKRLKLLRQVGFDGRRRYLETRWTRVNKKDRDKGC